MIKHQKPFDPDILNNIKNHLIQIYLIVNRKNGN